MIPDFKTYLKESVWGDLRKKSLGQEERIEDDVNQLNLDGFFDYLLKRYNNGSVDGHSFIIKLPRTNCITLMICENPEASMYYKMIIWDFNKNPYITIPNASTLVNSKYFKQATKDFDLLELDDDRFNPKFAIYPKDGSRVNNKFFITVIDSFIDNIIPPFERFITKKEDVNESVWGDLRKKSLGQEERVEDNLNNLEPKGFYEYVKKRYVILDQWAKFDYYVRSYQIDISVPIYMDNSTLHLSGPVRNSFTFHLNFEMCDDGKREITMLLTMESIKYSVDFRKSILYNKLCDEFHVYKKHHMGLQMLHIEPKDDGIVDCYFYLNVLDFITENYDESEHKVLDKAQLNESVWGDIRKKSMGQEERIENSVDQLSYEEFLNYIDNSYDQTLQEIEESVSGSNPYMMLIIIPIEKRGNLIPNVTINYQTTGQGMGAFKEERPSIVAVSKVLFEWYPELLGMLEEKYEVNTYGGEGRIYTVDTRENYLKNSDCMKILDIVFSVVNKPIITKK